MNCVVRTPNARELFKSSVGLAKMTLLNALKKSARKVTFKPSLIVVCLPSDRSTFQREGPRNGFARPARPSLLISTRRKLLNTDSGLANIFNPVPRLAGSPLVPILFVPLTPRLMSLPNEFGSTVGIAPEVKPRNRLPPQTPAPCVTVNASPLRAV